MQIYQSYIDNYIKMFYIIHQNLWVGQQQVSIKHHSKDVPIEVK